MSILLHPTKGVNPRLGACRHCGKSTSVILLGKNENKDTCDECGCVHYGGAERGSRGRRECKACGSDRLTRTAIEEHEQLFVDKCDECLEFEANCVKAIAENPGSVLYMCEKCGSEGVVRAESEFAKLIRKHFKDVPLDKPCGGNVPSCCNCESKETLKK